MGKWPFTRLHYGCNRCVAIAGPHVQVIDATTGDILNAKRISGNVICSAVNATHELLVTHSEDKRLDVWSLETLELQSSRELPKKATVVRFSPDGHAVLVADRFGDVFSYPRTPQPDACAPDPPKRETTASHTALDGDLILGHASIITAFLFSHDSRYIITADRDEHIRVSRYPQGHIIERFCLGHRLFLSTLCVPTFEPKILISGGGDPYLYFWDWMTGALRTQIPVAHVMRQFLRVREHKPRWHPGSKGGRGGRRRGKTGEGEGDEQPDRSAHNGNTVATETTDSNEYKTQPEAAAEHVFALAKIEAIEVNGERMLVFFAFGGSAIFYCSWSLSPTDVPALRYFEFARPVLDLVVGHRDQVLVSLDTAWTSTSEWNPACVLLSWQHGELVLCNEASPLMDALNGDASREASVAELASLELYAALSLLPKNADGEENGEGVRDVESRPSTPGPRSKRAGRLKTKQALSRRSELEQEQEQAEEPEQKKMKLGSDV